MAPPFETLHALAIPHPLQGHINPLLQFSHKLASSYNASITFIVTEHLLSRLSPQSLLPIKLVGLPDNLPHDHARQSTFLDAYDAVMGLEASTDAFLQDLAGRKQLPSVMIADTFVIWAHRLALKYGIPSVAFATTNVSALAVMSSVPKLINLGILPLKTVNGSSKYVDELITCIPGIPPLRPIDVPLSMRSPTISHYRMQFVKAQFVEASKAVAVLVNSVSEIEKTVLEGLEFKVPVFCIGPTLILNGENFALQGMGTSLWPEQEDCLLWLDKQASASVLYVSFGSMASLDKVQIEELAYGLEASEQPFLWVVRPGSFEGSLSELLPDGFLERTKNRGYIVPWCPQLLVLSHYATGAFLTHCGWNSILENICLGGVPIICWPDAAEQALNARVIVDVWKVGLRVTEEDNGIVKRKEVERVVRAVMQDEGAKAFIREAAEVRDKAKRAVQEGGSSLQNIEKVLEIVANAKARETASVRQ
eukprot:c23681_g3_i1 orf=218-1654(-)